MTLTEALAASLEHLKAKERPQHHDLIEKFMKARGLAAAGYGWEEIEKMCGLTKKDAQIVVFGRPLKR